MVSQPAPSIALYFYRLDRAAGGAERMVCALANGLADRGFDVHLLSWDEANAQSYYPLTARITWHRLGFRPGLADKLRRTRRLAGLLRKLGIRVLAGFVMSGDRTVYAAAKLAGVRLIAAERNAPAMYYLRYSRLQRFVSFTLLKLAHAITVQFPEFVTGYPAALRARISVIANPVPAAARHAQPDRPDGDSHYTLLAVGRFDAVQKRFDCLVRAFARIAGKHPNWRLLIVGEGPDEAALRHLIADLGLDGRVALQASSPDIFDAYVRANLFATPSRWEGFSNALAEAMAHGLPAVGFRDAAGVAHLIADGESGWLSDGLDDDATLAQALDAAMTDDGERARRGVNAVAAMAAYAPEAQIDQWVRLFQTQSEAAR